MAWGLESATSSDSGSGHGGQMRDSKIPRKPMISSCTITDSLSERGCRPPVLFRKHQEFGSHLTGLLAHKRENTNRDTELSLASRE